MIRSILNETFRLSNTNISKMMLPFSFKESDLFLVISSPHFRFETYTKVNFWMLSS